MVKITYGETPKSAPIRAGRIIFGAKREDFARKKSENTKKSELPKKKGS